MPVPAKVLEDVCIVLEIETLETRKSDQLDFHILPVWELKAVIELAFQAGRDYQAKVRPPQFVVFNKDGQALTTCTHSGHKWDDPKNGTIFNWEVATKLAKKYKGEVRVQ